MIVNTFPGRLPVRRAATGGAPVTDARALELGFGDVLLPFRAGRVSRSLQGRSDFLVAVRVRMYVSFYFFFRPVVVSV